MDLKRKIRNMKINLAHHAKANANDHRDTK